jgi:serine/threonine-protein kinase
VPLLSALIQIDLERLGQGAFGEDWKARDTELDRRIALTIPRREQLSEEESEKFLREARAAVLVRHQNIVSVHEVGRSGSDGQSPDLFAGPSRPVSRERGTSTGRLSPFRYLRGKSSSAVHLGRC